MENKARYTVVGLFLVLFTIAMVLFILWQARYSFQAEEKYQYRLYSTKSVAGLQKNSFVVYKGLTIGSIKDIDINPDNLEQIQIILEITNPKVIKENSYAIIQSQGITGNKHIEIDGGTTEAEPLIPQDGEYKTIPLKQSFFDTLSNDAGDITKKLNQTLTNINGLLKQENMQNFNDILQNIEKSTQQLNPTLQKLQNTLNGVDQLLQSNGTKTLNGIDAFTKEWTLLAKQVSVLVEKDMKEVLTNANKTLQGGSAIEKVISNMNFTLEKIGNTLDTFNQGGGDMIFKTRDVRYGPQEQYDE